jgi:hypothetical membrane protein
VKSKLSLYGAILWFLTIQYFIAEIVTALAWKKPLYSFRLNFISDLGATICPTYAPGSTVLICSPLHLVMDLSFVASGLLILGGILLLHTSFPRSRVVHVGLWGLLLGSFGLMGVGLLPENLHMQWHLISATFFFIVSNISLVILGIGLCCFSEWRVRAGYTILSGLIALIALLIFITPNLTSAIGAGYVERMIAYPYTIWLVVMGAYFLISRRKDHFI